MIKNRLHKNIRSYAYIIVFMGAIFIPVLGILFKIDENLGLSEKRVLAERPALKLTSDFAANFENYYNDNFGFRELLVKISNKLKTNVFKASTKPDQVLAGKNKYLFYNSLNDGVFRSYTNTNVYTKDQLDAHYTKLKTRKDTLAKKGIKYVCGFFPNKHTICPEYLPKFMQMQVKDSTNLADQMLNYFKAKQFPFFDIRKDLFIAKSKFPIYQKLDSHWNSNGSFVGYQAFCKKTFSDLKLTPFSRNDFNIKYKSTSSGDLISILGIDSIRGYSDSLPEYTLKDTSLNFEYISTIGYPKNTVITLNKNCGNKLTVVMFRDSYSMAFIQFLSLHYYKIIYIWSSYSNKFINQENPDIVISANVERYLTNL